MVFQDPRIAINPVHTIEDFLTEGLVINRRVSRAEARARAIAVLGDVGIENAPRRMRQHPQELSGGLLQRVMIASALLTDPRLLVADEPTTALDVITQEDVMAILDDLRRERSLSLLFITHDLDLAAAVCDRTAVMYGGRIVEIRGARLLHADPLHPYSAALAESRPDVEAALPRLTAIRGRPQSAYQAPRGCPFAPRCDHVEPACADWTPTLTQLDDGQVACRRARELRGTLLTAKQVPTSA
jgi:oligopeptide/dipeptide ABC transporter ATP-binding protein